MASLFSYPPHSPHLHFQFSKPKSLLNFTIISLFFRKKFGSVPSFGTDTLELCSEIIKVMCYD